MGAAENRNITGDETIRLLQEKAKESDDFLIKIFRRAQLSAAPGLIASLSGASVNHFVSPELWLPQLCGGGKFTLQAFHASDVNRAIGGFILCPIEGMEAHDVDFEAVGKANWSGPQALTFPPKREAARQEQMPLYSVHSPPAPGSGASANPTTWTRSAGGGVHREGYDEPNLFQRGAAALEAERRVLEKEKLDQEREKHRAELAAIQSKHESELKLSMATLRSEFVAAKPAGPDSTMMVFMEMMKQQAAAAQAAETRASEDRKEARAAQERADARFFTMIEKIGNKKEADPMEMVLKIVELTGGGKKGEAGIIEAQSKMMHSMAEMTQQQIGVAMEFVGHAADLQLGGQREEKPGWEKGVDKIAKAIGNFAAARAAQPPSQQIVGGSVMQQPPPPQTYEQQARQPPPPPQPQQPQQPRPPQNHTEKSVLLQVKEAIEAKHDVKEVAAAIIQYVGDPSITQALAAANNDPEQAIKNTLGPWINAAPSNTQYFNEFIAELTAQGQAAGILPKDDESDEDDDDEGDDEEDDQGDDE